MNRTRTFAGKNSYTLRENRMIFHEASNENARNNDIIGSSEELGTGGQEMAELLQKMRGTDVSSEYLPDVMNMEAIVETVLRNGGTTVDRFRVSLSRMTYGLGHLARNADEFAAAGEYTQEHFKKMQAVDAEQIEGARDWHEQEMLDWAKYWLRDKTDISQLANLALAAGYISEEQMRLHVPIEPTTPQSRKFAEVSSNEDENENMGKHPVSSVAFSDAPEMQRKFHPHQILLDLNGWIENGYFKKNKLPESYFVSRTEFVLSSLESGNHQRGTWACAEQLYEILTSGKVDGNPATIQRLRARLENLNPQLDAVRRNKSKTAAPDRDQRKSLRSISRLYDLDVKAEDILQVKDNHLHAEEFEHRSVELDKLLGEVRSKFGLFLTREQWHTITTRTEEAYSRLRNELQRFGSPRTYREWPADKQTAFREVLLREMKPLTTEILQKLDDASTSSLENAQEMLTKIAPEGLAMMTYVMEQFVKPEDLDDVTMLLSDLMTELVPEKAEYEKDNEKPRAAMAAAVIPKDAQLLLGNLVGKQEAERLTAETEVYLQKLHRDLSPYEPINEYREWSNAKKKNFQRILMRTLGPAKERLKALSEKNITSIAEAMPAIAKTFMPEGVAVAMYLSEKFTEPHHANDALALVSDLLHDLLPEEDR